MEVIGVVGSAEDADEAIARYYPDVLTLDIAMPGMNGLTYLSRLMQTQPIPVVVVASSALVGSAACERATRLGASSCFDKARLILDSKRFLKALRMAKKGTIDLAYA